MKFIFDLQLFAASSSNSSTKGGSTQTSSSYTEGGSSSHTEGSSHTHSESDTHTEGGSHSESYGKSWYSGKVEDNTQKHRDAYNTDYEEGGKVTDAYDNLQNALNSKPTFESKYEDKLNSLYESIMNREKFSYDFNADEMYRQYRDKYTAQGKQAMEDTLGRAQAMNGGYGSSYAQSVGQQTYQQYLQQLNDMIPTLRDQAFEQYKYEGNELLDRYNITANAYDREYGQYRDDVSDWQSDRAYYDAAYRDERNYDYNQFVNERGYWNDEYWKEKMSETSNYQITDSRYWEDSHTSADSDTTYSEDTQSSNWSRSNSIANTSNWSNTNTNSYSASGGSGGSTGNTGSGLSSWLASDSSRNVSASGNNNYKLPSAAMQSTTATDKDSLGTDKDIADTVEYLRGMSSARRALEYQKMREKYELTDDDINWLKELVSEKPSGFSSYTTAMANLKGLRQGE